MGKGMPKSLKREFLMKFWEVSSLDELTEKFNQQEHKQVVQENNDINDYAINPYMPLDTEDIE